MSTFISCDWGTSNLRLRLVDANSMKVFQEVETTDGIASIYRLWQMEGGALTRVGFYLSFLEKHISNWLVENGPAVERMPLIISGMASSTIGLKELEYAGLPMPANGSSLFIQQLELNESFPNPVFIVSGVCMNDDIMRGEETLLAGCETIDRGTELFLFPGTHCKHVIVQNGEARSFKTYMSGEFFDILSRHSVLAASIQPGDFIQRPFSEGVKEGAASNLLSAAFKVRVNQVFRKSTAAENFHYLSGLIIGNELRDITREEVSRVTVVASDSLRARYALALRLLNTTQEVVELNSNAAIVKGHCRLLHRVVRELQ